MKRFRDNDPIPHANELQHAGTATVVETPEKSPMSMNTATEQHADAKSDEDDLSTTKDLTQGTEDVYDRNVRCQDLCMSLKASVQGTSAKRAETTPVMLKRALPHKLQKRPQDSLQVTPYACKQEAVDSIVTAGCMDRMVQLANLPETIADVDKGTLLGRELVVEAYGVHKGNRMEHEGKLRLHQTDFYCEEKDQHSGNATENIPITYGLPLKGEWTVYPSGKLSKSKGCSRGMDECVSIDEAVAECRQQQGMADVNPGHGA